MKNKGISLIVLIITIVVIIILATAIIVNIARTSIIKNANEATVKQDFKTMQEELNMYIADEFTKSKGKLDITTVDANTVDEVKKILKSSSKSKYIEYVRIEDGKIVFVEGIDEQVKEWAEEALNSKGNTVIVPSSPEETGIRIEVTPENQTSEYVEEQIVKITATSKTGWSSWSSQIAITGSNKEEPSEEQWESLTLEETEEELKREGEAIVTEETEGEYYLWVKITTNGKTQTNSFGPYKIGETPQESDLVCIMTETKENGTVGVVEVGSTKEYSDWKCIYQINGGKENEVESGTTTKIEVVKNDIVTVKYKKEGSIDVTKTVTMTELKVGYILTYDTNGGISGPGSGTQYDNGTFTISSVEPTKAGYTFIGWNTEISGTGTTYKAGESITISTNITLYAVWEEKAPEVTLGINTENKITEGTVITVNATSGNPIQKITLKLGNTVIYEENVSSVNTYEKELDIEDLAGLKSVLFYSTNNLTASITTGESTGTDTISDIQNYTVGSAASLQKLAKTVNSGKTLEGETILQIADINLSTVCSSSLGSWEPIGYVSTTSYWFNGIYNGNGNEINNIYIYNSEDKSVGLFGFLGYKGIIKNVTVSGNVTQNYSYRATGGIVGRNEGVIQNCTNDSNVICNNNNSANGGIAGVMTNGEISDCINNGETSYGEFTGGIVGRIYLYGQDVVSNNNSESDKVVITENTNNGKVTSEMYAGGILGQSYNSITLEECSNLGIITGGTNVGGIVGYSNSAITNCQNSGAVTATSSIAGGISGYSKGDITSCKNKGTVTSQGNPSDQQTTQGTGGIVGRLNMGTVQNCSNNEDITVTTGFFAGGIVGVGYGGCTITQSYNHNANIISYNNGAGGILGLCKGAYIGNCYNYLETDEYYIKNGNGGGAAGGIVGHHATDGIMTIEYCYNIGENITVTHNAPGSIAGVNQRNDTKLKNCYVLSTNTLNTIGYPVVTPSENSTTKKTVTEFKYPVKNTSSVAYLLNGNKTSGNWSQSSSVNNGYPYLVNNVP